MIAWVTQLAMTKATMAISVAPGSNIAARAYSADNDTKHHLAKSPRWCFRSLKKPGGTILCYADVSNSDKQQQQQQQQQQFRLEFRLVVCYLLLSEVVSASPTEVADAHAGTITGFLALWSRGFSYFSTKNQRRLETEKWVLKPPEQNGYLNNPHQSRRTRRSCNRGSGVLGGKGDHGPHALPSSDRLFLGDAVSQLA